MKYNAAANANCDSGCGDGVDIFCGGNGDGYSITSSVPMILLMLSFHTFIVFHFLH